MVKRKSAMGPSGDLVETKKARKLFLGCAGWSYKEWVGPFYDSEKTMLRQYSEIFDTAEINSSFYGFPEKGTILGMTRYTPKGFMFSAKINQRFTHELGLRIDEKAQRELDEFCLLFDPLLTSERLGCMLIQLPPSQRKDDRLLEGFFAALPHRYDYVIEFRHPSWMDDSTWKLLAKYNVAYCIVDEPLLTQEIHVTSDIGYVRWHGRGKRPWYDYRYTERQLEEWLPKIEEIQAETKRTFGIFNNHFHGYAPENCIQIMRMLGIADEKQLKALRKIQDHIEGKRVARVEAHETTLDTFTSPSVERVEDLLSLMTSETRLGRAADIDENQVKLELGVERLTGQVKHYPVVIDFKARRIVHECEDWNRVSVERMLCKHLAKFLLSAPADLSRKVLMDIRQNMDDWRFESGANDQG